MSERGEWDEGACHRRGHGRAQRDPVAASRRRRRRRDRARSHLQNSIDDIYLSLDHGDPKSVRVFDGGHMGEGPVVPTIVEWLSRQLCVTT